MASREKGRKQSPGYKAGQFYIWTIIEIWDSIMKRRRFFQTLGVVPAAPALVGAPQQPPPPPPITGASVARPGSELRKLDVSVADAVAETVTRFLTGPQLAALRKLSDILMPATNGFPGALEACAPEFLDFLLKESSAERQELYRQGLDALDAEAKRNFSRPFSDIDASHTAKLLAPLREPWTYRPPADSPARFLHAPNRTYARRQ